MLKVNIQHFGGRGQGAGGRYRGGAGVHGGGGGGGGTSKEVDVYGMDNIIHGRDFEPVKQGLDIMTEINNEYDAVNGSKFKEAKYGDPSILGSCDMNGNVYIASQTMNIDSCNKAYDACIANGFHPARGDKTGLQAVVYHEYGHSVVERTAEKMGMFGMDLATRIVKEARNELKEKGVVIMARKISEYATTNNHETIAEAFSDVKCNGKKATAQSKKIVEVLNRYAKAAR